MSTDQILAQLGPCVLLAIPLGKKGPNTKEWQKLTLTHMTPEYLASLNGSKNIGVSLGAASQGLCSIDVDNDDELSGSYPSILRSKGASSPVACAELISGCVSRRLSQKL